ncbi:methionine adenosyltransferase domain-containing protein [Candidatus Saccharibacteria bacterium]|nr:methionine adenosyltransferase domain-containing protein [Candidatus Saccharibacteria bacterium]
MMKQNSFYRTAESVSPKHPDKLCDQISDAILDAYLEKDPDARVAAETCGGHGVVFVTGEITSKVSDADVNVEKIVKRITGDDKIEVHTKIVKQSPEIAQGVDTGGAGDQGIMIGYATAETPELLPLEVVLSRRLNKFIYAKHPFDGKTQVTLNGDKIDSIVVSFQNVKKEELKTLVEAFLKQENISPAGIKLHLNPAGDWSQGGFEADTGLTGRKLIVDNYGPRIPIGGGCFSGKDPSKVDRSAAYMARRVAVDYLRKRNAKEVFVRLAYAIGVAEPLEKTVIIDGEPEEVEGYDLTPNGIIKYLDLKRPIYERSARYGHFGEGFNWDD